MISKYGSSLENNYVHKMIMLPFFDSWAREDDMKNACHVYGMSSY